MVQKQIVQIGENKYHCLVAGQGEPLVLLHGFTGSVQTFEPFIEKWASVFQVIAIDLPGHGQTETPQFPNMMVFCDELALILQAFHIKKCHLLGYSMGGRIALSFAKRHPYLVQSLLLESASPGVKKQEERLARKKRDQALAEKIMKNGIPQFVKEWESQPLFATQEALSDDQKEQVQRERLSQTAAGLSQSLLQMGTGSQPSWWEQLDSLQMPVQLIVGELDDKFVTINHCMERAINQSEITIVPEVGHAIHVEQPEKFAIIVMEFLYLAGQKE